MTGQHPITPPLELVREWIQDAIGTHFGPYGYSELIAARAAQWGADQQLAKDAKWLDYNALNEPHLRITPVGESLKEAMRPKPLSLKKQALIELGDVYNEDKIDDIAYDTICRAIEALPE